jgi:phage terminase small subunit
MRPLTPKQEAFIVAWLVRRNSTRAYMDAYPGASYSTASGEGSRLFRDPRISLEIKKLLAAERERLAVTAQTVTDALAAMAFTTIGDVYTEEGTIIAPADMPRDVALAVKRIKRREILMATEGDAGKRKVIGYSIEIEMHDKVAPLRLLGLELGMFTEKVEQTADDALLVALREGRERALVGT